MSYQTGANLAAIVSAVAAVAGLAGGGIGFFLSRRARIRKFEYPDRGDAGENILSASVHRVARGQRYAMTAKIPDAKNLTVRFFGQPLRAGDEAGGFVRSGAWYFKMSPENWRHMSYDEGPNEVGPSQVFKARGGWAEMDLEFERAGSLRIEVHEGDSPTPSWTKTIQIV